MNMRQITTRSFVSIVALMALLVPGTAPTGLRQATSGIFAKQDYGQLPLQFELNQGQADESVHFLAHGRGYNLYLTSDEAALALATPTADAPSTLLRLQFVGATAEPQVTGVNRLPGVVNYYVGRDPSQWHAGIPTYAQVRYRGVYPGIDVLFYGNEQRLEHDFVVSPGADPSVITLQAHGADALEIDRAGDLVLTIGGSVLRLLKPFIYQEINGVRHSVDGGYVLKDEGQFGFEVGAYNVSRPLIIDPVLDYSTYFGGSSDDYAYDLAVGSTGDVYITGSTYSTDFPVLNATQPEFGGGGIDCPADEDVAPYRLCYDAFVTRLNAAGTALIYSTYIGLPGDDEGKGIAVDGAGNAYMTGYLSLSSESLPDMFIYKYAQLAKLDPTGALSYWIYFGSVESEGLAVAADSAGRAYMTGEVASSGFLTTTGAIQFEREELIDAFVTVIDTVNNQVVYSTYLGGDGSYCESCYSSGKGIAVDSAGKIYVTGHAAPSFPTTPNAYQQAFNGFWKAFVAKIDPTIAGPAGLVYSSYLGGELSEFGEGIALDTSGKVYITGSTISDDFPTTAGAYDRSCGTDGICNTLDTMVCDPPPPYPPPCHLDSKADVFVAKMDLSQSGAASLVYATYVGGSGVESGRAIAVDTAGNAYVTGYTRSPDFPLINPVQGAYADNLDAFVLKLNAAGSGLDFSTVMGGGGDDEGKGIGVDSAGNTLVTGYTGSGAFPTANPLQPHAGGWEAFIAKLAPSSVPILTHHVYLPLVIR